MNLHLQSQLILKIPVEFPKTQMSGSLVNSHAQYIDKTIRIQIVKTSSSFNEELKKAEQDDFIK